MICKHCGHEIERIPNALLWAHIIGTNGGRLSRCQEDMTEYGYNAEPVGQACVNPCLGTVKGDPNERTAA